MLKRCNNCFEQYEELGNMCPHCGYCEGDAGKELYHLSPGTTLKSPEGKVYIIGEVVGSGGFGIIYKAWEQELERIVAIKEYFPTEMVARGVGEQKVSVFSNKRAAEYKKGLHNFLQEATIMSLCADCDNVCNSYNKFTANDTAYMVMEFLNGKTLKAYVKERKGELLEESEILNYIEQVLNGLGEIHKRGVVHLDIAPDNIYVMPDGRIKIADFGAAKAQNVKKDESEVVLKPGFAPPEQYRHNAKMGPETDIYAVGANLYWLLTGRVPLEATDREHEDIMEEPAKLNMVSVALNNVTMRAMALEPELRYKNAHEFIADLHRQNVRSLEAERKRRKRNRNMFIASIIMTLLLAVTVSGYLTIFKNKIKDDTILLWVVPDAIENSSYEKERYESLVAMFKENYPQINVQIEVKDPNTVQSDFANCDVNNRPDLVEVTSFDATALDSFINLNSIRKSKQDELISVLKDANLENKSIPVGVYFDVIYTQKDKNISELTACNDKKEFVELKTGYYEGDSRDYLKIQSDMAGRYQLVESNNLVCHTAEEFALYKKTTNKKKAASALLEYMMTDAAQDILHVQFQSNYMPVSENAWNEFIEVYGEFDYLKNSLNQYTVK